MQIKNMLVIAALSLSGLSAFAQGTVNFANNSSTKVINATTGQPVATSPAGAFKVALYYAVDGVSNQNAYVQIGNAINFTTPPGAGMFSGGTYTTPDTTAPGGFAMFQVRAWSTVGNLFSTYESALASGQAETGFSNILRVQTGDGALISPGSLVNSGLQSFTIAVPEPSTYALGACGLVGLFFARRRKA